MKGSILHKVERYANQRRACNFVRNLSTSSRPRKPLPENFATLGKPYSLSPSIFRTNALSRTAAGPFSGARVSRSISSIYKAAAGGKIDVAAHNARGVGPHVRVCAHESSSFSSPLLSFSFSFSLFFFLSFFFLIPYALVPDSSSVKCVSLSPVTIASRGVAAPSLRPPWTPWCTVRPDIALNNGH